MTPKQIGIFVLAAGGSFAACGASIPPPNDSYAAATAEVGRAEAGGAPAVPDAKLHLQLAQEDLQRSKQLIGYDNKRATSLCTLATAEAQLALTLAKQSTAEDIARQAQSAAQTPR